MKNVSKMFAAITLTLLLAACGGGGGGGSTDDGSQIPSNSGPVSSSSSSSSGGSTSSSGGAATTGFSTTPTDGTNNVQTGHYVDYVVQGLRYQTATKSGYTDATGTFQFMPGESVQFYLYDTALPAYDTALVITPADAVNVDMDYTINLLRLLQAIDTDHNPDNGITLPTVAAGETWNFNLSEQVEAFETDPKVLAFLAEYAGGASLPTLESTVNHFNASIASLKDDYSIDLTNKTITGYATSNLCKDPNQHLAPRTVILHSKDYYYQSLNWWWKGEKLTALGTGDCEDLASDPGIKITTYYGAWESFNWNCGAICTYKGLNKLVLNPKGPDNSGKSIILMWHTPGTNKFVWAKRWLPDVEHGTTGPYYTTTYHYTVQE